MPRRRQGRDADADRTVRFLILHLNGMGGAIRAVVTLAGELAKTRPVEIVTLQRNVSDAFFPIPDGVKVNVLDDRLRQRGLPVKILRHLPSLLLHPHDDAHDRFSLRSDVVLIRWLRGVRTGTVVTTRPALDFFVSQFAKGPRVVVQVHTSLVQQRPAIVDGLTSRLEGADAVVALTERDARALRERLSAPVTVIPIAVSDLAGTPSVHRRQVIMSAGRLLPVKGFDLLIEAYGLLASEFPDWRVEVYGRGRELEPLRNLIDRLQLDDHVAVLDRTPNIGEVMATTAIYALGSRHEGFPNVLLEAMSKEMAVVAFDCETGPREILTPGYDGLLVQDGDVGAFATALRQLMTDGELRMKLGEAAAETVRQYSPEAVTAQWLPVLDGMCT